MPIQTPENRKDELAMALRKILKQGDAALEKVCRPVEKFDRKLRWLLDDLKETLEEAGGVGLAAPQVGILRRVVVVMDAEEQMIELVNPVIITRRGSRWAGKAASACRGCTER